MQRRYRPRWRIHRKQLVAPLASGYAELRVESPQIPVPRGGIVPTSADPAVSAMRKRRLRRRTRSALRVRHNPPMPRGPLDNPGFGYSDGGAESTHHRYSFGKSTNCPQVTEEKWPRLRLIAGMMRDLRGNNDGRAKAAPGESMVERRCEDSTHSCTRETFRATGGQETSPLRRRGRAKGDETGDSVPVNKTEGSLTTASRIQHARSHCE